MYKNALKEDLIRVLRISDGTVESTDTIAKLKTKIENNRTIEFELCSHTCPTAAFLQLPNDSTSGKSIQMSSNRLIIRLFKLRQQLGGILTAIRRAISLPEILILHRQHAFFTTQTLSHYVYLHICACATLHHLDNNLLIGVFLSALPLRSTDMLIFRLRP
ncbi:hypothetical protein TNCV_4173221 [Trichonephila clavipes]|nr:hypothetical protein TNCV_4173221 [Trichonephila clavipes]